MNKILSILLKVLLVPVGFFVLTFTVYFFNLDMKGMAMLEPLFLKHYDKIDRKWFL